MHKSKKAAQFLLSQNSCSSPPKLNQAAIRVSRALRQNSSETRTACVSRTIYASSRASEMTSTLLYDKYNRRICHHNKKKGWVHCGVNLWAIQSDKLSHRAKNQVAWLDLARGAEQTAKQHNLTTKHCLAPHPPCQRHIHPPGRAGGLDLRPHRAAAHARPSTGEHHEVDLSPCHFPAPEQLSCWSAFKLEPSYATTGRYPSALPRG